MTPELHRTLCLVTGLWLVVAGAGQGADGAPELVTDRPDQTESSVVVPPGHVQVEAGVTFARGAVDIDESLEGPGLLVRAGLTPRVELRFGWDGFIREEADGDTAEGRGDGSFGTKVYVCPESGLRPEAAFIGSVTLPWGEDEFSSGHADPEARLTVSWTLPSEASLGVNAGWASTSVDGGGHDDSFLYTLVYGRALGDSWGAFIEFFGDVPTDATDEAAHLLDGGVTWLVRPDLQFDLSVGVGLTDESEDWFAGCGISRRFPN